MTQPDLQGCPRCQKTIRRDVRVCPACGLALTPLRISLKFGRGEIAVERLIPKYPADDEPAS